MLCLRALSTRQSQHHPTDIDKAYQAEFGPRFQVRMIAIKDKAKAKDLEKLQAKAR